MSRLLRGYHHLVAATRSTRLKADITMIYGGGILVTILIILAIVYFAKRV